MLTLLLVFAALDDRQESSLIEIMVCCVKQAATGEYPVGRGPASRRPTTKEARQVTDDKAKLTEHFIVALPQLLARVSFHAMGS
jgi:cohesin complex subunit SA-1/2